MYVPARRDARHRRFALHGPVEGARRPCLIYPQQMRVGDIRAAVVAELRALHPDPAATLIRCELGLCLGETRVDVAAINGLITGWEIKSPQDRLDRLPKQVEIYNRVLDEAIIVAAGRHTTRVQQFVPGWWGIVVVEGEANGPRLVFERLPRRNPLIDPFSVSQLLWRDEAYDVLRSRQLHLGLAKATRWKLWQALAENLALADLQAEVRRQLRARQEW
jgi:hypothetical protein